MTAEPAVVRSVPIEDLPPYQAKRRQRIVTAARGLLEQQPYEQIQIRDVAAAGSVALGTLYRYFSSKEHLYAAVLVEWTAEFAEPTSRRGAPSDPWRRLHRRIRVALDAFERRPQYYRLLVVLLRSSDPNASVLVDRFRDITERPVEADLAELDPAGARDYAVLLWAVLSNLLSQNAFNNLPMAEARRISDHFLRLLRDRLSGPPSAASTGRETGPPPGAPGLSARPGTRSSSPSS